jgi:hypothetical protein
VSTTTALTKVGSSALSKLKPHLIRWFLKKYYPIETRKLVIELYRFPNISLDFDSHEHSIWFEFELNNFTFYNLELLKLECIINANDYNLVTIKESIIHELKVDGTYKFQTNHQLTPGEATRIKKLVPNVNLAVAQIAFYITVRSSLGLEELNLTPKKACIQIREYPPPKIT